MRQVHGRLNYVSSPPPKHFRQKFVFRNVRTSLVRSPFPCMRVNDQLVELDELFTYKMSDVKPSAGHVSSICRL